jgi:hypothetical protein
VTLVELAGVEHLLDAMHEMHEVTSADRSLLVLKTCLDVRATLSAAATFRPDCPPSPSTPSPVVSPRGDSGDGGGDDTAHAAAAAAAAALEQAEEAMRVVEREAAVTSRGGGAKLELAAGLNETEAVEASAAAVGDEAWSRRGALEPAAGLEGMSLDTPYARENAEQEQEPTTTTTTTTTTAVEKQSADSHVAATSAATAGPVTEAVHRSDVEEGAAAARPDDVFKAAAATGAEEEVKGEGAEGSDAVDTPPFSASVLTRLISDCLDDACSTTLLLTCSPAEVDFHVTHTLLSWASSLLSVRAQGVEGRGDITLNLSKQVDYVQVHTPAICICSCSSVGWCIACTGRVAPLTPPPP